MWEFHRTECLMLVTRTWRWCLLRRHTFLEHEPVLREWKCCLLTPTECFVVDDVRFVVKFFRNSAEWKLFCKSIFKGAGNDFVLPLKGNSWEDCLTRFCDRKYFSQSCKVLPGRNTSIIDGEKSRLKFSKLNFDIVWLARFCSSLLQL